MTQQNYPFFIIHQNYSILNKFIIKVLNILFGYQMSNSFYQSTVRGSGNQVKAVVT